MSQLVIHSPAPVVPALVATDGEVGVIGPGKPADIVIWDKDPIADITVLQRPAETSLIITDGRIVDSEGGGFRQLSEEQPRTRTFSAG